MDIQITLPAIAEKLFPIFIASPCNHSGGALLQRAVCQSENSICYGDNMFDEIGSLVDWAGGLIERHENQKAMEEKVLIATLDMKPMTWMPELAPPFDIYTATLLSVVYNLPLTAQNFAKENAKDVWMVARANVQSVRMDALMSLFPKSKSIFIYRNPFDVIRDSLRDNQKADLREICSAWNGMMRDYLEYSNNDMVKIRYEDASEDTDNFIKKFEEFTGSKGMPVEILEATNEAETDSDYEISSDIRSLIEILCEDMLAVYYPNIKS
ncbi:MAG: hypothetical protein HOF74_00005 [Gammaproteobacteria bacterium]|jgi:hypothetical protein|nr:hypothetical protein [Gammaproteobacteria bacterium]